jgi:putative flippase GtrA
VVYWPRGRLRPTALGAARPAPIGATVRLRSAAVERPAIRQLVRLPAVRQFVKFCIIGASSTVIDVGLLNLLVHPTLLFSGGLHWIPAQIISFAIAVGNSFVWNSLWTFKGMGTGARHQQFVKFVLVNIGGLLLNVLVMKMVMFTVHPSLFYHGNPSPRLLNAAKAVAIVVVSLWNFNANKRWTFNAKPVSGNDEPA